MIQIHLGMERYCTSTVKVSLSFHKGSVPENVNPQIPNRHVKPKCNAHSFEPV